MVFSAAIRVLFLSVSLQWPTTFSRLTVPGLRSSQYVKTGDLNIGMLASVHEYSASQFCGPTVTGFVETVEMLVYTIEDINRRHDVLPNVTLGYVILDDCGKDVTALARSLSFLPEDENTSYLDDLVNVTEGTQGFRDVIGVVGPANSAQAVMVASLMSIFHIPILGTLAGSPDLSDKTRFQYFLRMVPPNTAMAYALVDIADRFGWSYVSLVYSEGNLGENGAKDVERRAAEKGLCIAFSKRIPSVPTDVDIQYILHQLKRHNQAKVVILQLEYVHIASLFRHVTLNNLEGHFVWLSNSIVASMAFSRDYRGAESAIFPGYDLYNIPGFSEYFSGLNPWNTEDPWIAELWKETYNCVLEPVGQSADNQTLCSDFTELPANIFRGGTASSLAAEAVTILAHVLHDVISDKCPEAFQAAVPIPPGCIDPGQLLQALRKSSVQMYGRTAIFDESGDRLGHLIVKQLQGRQGYGLNSLHLGQYDTATNNLTVDESLLKWYALQKMDMPEETTENPPTEEAYFPKSVCSDPCPPKTYKVRLELPCCWECQSCRDYEVIVKVNGTDRCQMCEENTWPDEETATVCQPLPPEYLHPADWIATSLFAITACCLLLSIVCVVLFVKYRKERLVKATSRELSIIILLGALLASLGSLTFLMKPSQKTCVIGSVGFHLSVNMLYSPLLLKTCRIYRIFSAGRKGQKLRPRCVSSQCLTIFVTGMITFQVVLCVISEVTTPSKALLKMPVRTQRYVELVCERHLQGFLVPVSYNLAIIVVCAALGFLTRQLPENFNESWYIFVSTASTAFMWAVFIPTYFNAFYAYHKAALLAFCLVLNAFITLACLFCPKLYAIFYVDDKVIRFGVATKMSHSSGDTCGSSATGTSTLRLNRRVEPSPEQPVTPSRAWLSVPPATKATVTPSASDKVPDGAT